MQTRVFSLLTGLGTIFLAGCGQPAEPPVAAQESEANLNSEANLSMAVVPAAKWEDALRQGQPVTVIVEMDGSVKKEALRKDRRLRALPRRHEERRAFEAGWNKRLQESVIQGMQGQAMQVVRRYDNLPFLAVELHSVEALQALRQQAGVARLHEEQRFSPSLTQSLPFISASEGNALGATGNGTTVAVLDTGVDYTRSAFGSCTTVGAVGCKVAYVQDFAPDDGALDDDDHGTNVSGIVLGVAPSAKVIGLDVFRTDGFGYTSDILAAMDWVILHKDEYNIAAMNLSLGGGGYTSACDGEPMSMAISEAYFSDILSAVASGNNGFTNKVSSPACATDAVTVGAVYDAAMGGISWSTCRDASTTAGAVTCFSNSSEQVDVLAPGALITAAGITMGGTSQATPHVAGMIAALHSLYPDEPGFVTEIRLHTDEVGVLDPKSGIRRPLVNLRDAASRAAPDFPDTGAFDTGFPDTGGGMSGFIIVNDGDMYTRTTSVSLTFEGLPSTATQICVSNTETCTNFGPITSPKTWSLTRGDGEKIIYATLKSAAGEVVGEPLVGGIVLDATPPTNPTVTAEPDDGVIGLSWAGAEDGEGSGVVSYKVVGQLGTSAPRNCATGTTVYEGEELGALHEGLTNGQSWSYRVCAIDEAGNTSTGVTLTSMARSESDPPTAATVSIAAGAEYTSTNRVTVTTHAEDASGVASMCLSTATTCTAWINYASSASVTLGTTAGTQTVRAWYRDTMGNVTPEPATDTIVYDNVPPSNPTATVTRGTSGSLGVSWTAATDAASGIGGYRLVYQAGTAAPRTCTSGTSAYSGTAREATVTGLTNGTTYSFKLCAVDGAGNLSTGASFTGVPAAETTPPSDGAISINSGAALTNNATVSVTFSATDASGVSSVCLSSTSTCTAWTAYAPTTRTFALPRTTGTQTVRAWFRDASGNVTPSPASDTISLDITAPTNPRLTATAGSTQVALSWTTATDVGSSVASYRVVSTPTRAPANCTTGTTIYTGTGTSFTHTSLTNGTVYGYRVCAVDAAGNLSTGATATATPRP